MVSRQDTIDTGRSFIDTPWLHQGRQPGVAIDCVGVPALIAFQLGLIRRLPRADYPRRPNGTFLAQFRESGLTETVPNNIQSGDVAVFTNNTHPCHCGIYIMKDEPWILHAHAGHRKVVEEPLSAADPIIGLVTHAFMFPGLSD